MSDKRLYKKPPLKQSYSELTLKRVKGSFGLAGKTRSDGCYSFWIDAHLLLLTY